MHRPLIHGLIALICLSLGAGGALWIVQGRPQPSEADLPGPRPVPVDWRAVNLSEVAREVTGTGTLRAAREVRLAFEFGGRIASVWGGLADGIVVPEGTELVSLDVGPLNLEIQAQQTAVELAEIQGRGARSDQERAAAAVEIADQRLKLLADEEDRWKSLTAEGRSERARLHLAAQARLAGALALEEAKRGEESSRSRALAAEKEVRLARDRVAILADQRHRSALRAPFGGRFSLSVRASNGLGAQALPEPGDALGPLEPVGSLLDTTSLLLNCDVHEDDVGTIFVGAAAVLAPHARPGLLLGGRVTAIGARVDPVLRSVPVEVAFGGTSEKPLDLPAGSFARVEIQARPARDVLFVDEDWIAYRSGQAVVFVIETASSGGSPAARPVARARRITFLDGIHSGGRIVTSGLEPGARVITSSLELIGDGTELILR